MFTLLVFHVDLTVRRSNATEDKPNFIVIFCDNLGYGDIEPFNAKTLHRTPHLNQMAKEGRRFTHFYVSAGVCTPSRASLMTGCYAQRIGMHTNPRDGLVLRPVSPFGLNPNETTVAELLKTQGYATAIIGKWHLGDQPEFLPTRHGFDWFFGVPYSDDMTQRVWKQDSSKWPPLPLMDNERVVEAPCDRESLTARYTVKAKEWITRKKNVPFFLYLPHAMPGSTSKPFASKSFRGQSRNGAWGDSIEELDWSVGEILKHLKSLKLAEKTLVIWTSDNGAPMKPDAKDFSRGSNRPLHGRGYSTSEGGFRAPTIMWQPGKIPGGTVNDKLATTMDILPSFAKLAGGSIPASTIDGKDITELIYGNSKAESPHDVFFYYQQDQLQAVRSGPYKLFLPVKNPIRHPHFSGNQTPEPLLFHLYDDISCRHNLAKRYPDLVAELSRKAEAARIELGDRGRKGAGQRPPGKIAGKPKPQLLR